LDGNGDPLAGYDYLPVTSKTVTRAGRNQDLADMFTGTGYRYEGVGDEWMAGVTSCAIRVVTAAQNESGGGGGTYNSATIDIPQGTAITYDTGYFLVKANRRRFYAMALHGYEFFIDYSNVRFRIRISDAQCTNHTNTYVRTDIVYRTEWRDISPPSENGSNQVDEDSGSSDENDSDDDDGDESDGSDGGDKVDVVNQDDGGDDDTQSTQSSSSFDSQNNSLNSDSDGDDRKKNRKLKLAFKKNKKMIQEMKGKIRKLKQKEIYQKHELMKKMIKRNRKSVKGHEDKLNKAVKIGTI
jgi:hypothetical protein